MQIVNRKFPSIESVTAQYPQSQKASGMQFDAKSKSFAQILDEASGNTSKLKFSKHAAGRLSERNIEISDAQMGRLNAGMEAADKKGINESLVLVDQLAFIVNVKNQTVITAMDQKDALQNVFTNIDGAVIA